ncbi:MAG: helicase-related protein [Candidatus Woesearchaeota archaeon]
MQDPKKQHLSLAIDTILNNKQALIFYSTKRSAEKGADDIARQIGKLDNKEIVKEGLLSVSDSILKTYPNPTRQCERLSNAVKSGVAFHHSGLPSKQRKIIEDEFRKNNIRIICCTPTLAAGVDLPSYRTIIRDVKRYGHRGMDYIPVLEYLQMAGRSGRPSYDTHGECFLIAQSEGEMNILKDRYINGIPEEIYSKLAAEPALRSHILSLIVQGHANSEEELLEFMNNSFYGYQYKDKQRIMIILRRILKFLEDNNFIIMSRATQENDADDLYSSAYDILKNNSIKSTLLGNRISELYLDPLSASIIIKHIKNNSIASYGWFPLIHLLAQSLELKPYPSIRKKDYETIEEQLGKEELLVGEEDHDYDYEAFLKTLKLAIIMESWIKEEDEKSLMEKYDITPGEFHAKLTIYDWLCYSATEICRIIEKNGERTTFQKLRLMIKNGVSQELISLVRIKGIGRKRARILYNNNIRTRTDILKTDIRKLELLVGLKTAQKIKGTSIIAKDNRQGTLPK